MSILDRIGNTPLVEIQNIWSSKKVKILAKVEGMNPGGSIKDRVALTMIQDAIHKKQLLRGMSVIEATSGNTGIGLALVCSVLDYNCILIMPANVSIERAKLIEAFGAHVITVEGNTDAAIELSNKMDKINFSWQPNQFGNPNNWKTHFMTTGPEISGQLQALRNWTGYSTPNPDVFVATCGTTGTIRGCKAWFDYNYNQVSQWHKGEEIATKTVAVFPRKDSKIQGLKNLEFSKVPAIYDKQSINESTYARDKESFEMTKRLAREEGLFCGLSSGAAMCEAIRQANKLDYGVVVVILPDNGYRYISEGVY